MVLVGDVDVSSGVDQHVFGLRGQYRGKMSTSLLWIVRDEIANVLGYAGVRDIVELQPTTLVRDRHDVLHGRQALLIARDVDVVGSELTALVLEVRYAQLRWRHRRGERRDGFRL